MAGKPELPAATGVQNVVVYVSSDNFAQAYSVRQQNVGQSNNHSSLYNDTFSTANTVAPLVAKNKNFVEKQQKQKYMEFTSNEQMLNSVPDYFTTGTPVISQNGFTQNLLPEYKTANSDVSYGKTVKNYVNIESGYINRPSWFGKSDVNNGDIYLETNCVVNNNNASGEGLSNSVRCESVRSETAESSCSSLSSVDESLVIAAQSRAPEMVVYDSGTGEKHGSVMVAMEMPGTQHVQLVQPSVTVPFGWKRLTNNGEIIYISPSNTALNSLEQVRIYLQTPGTCKCGLECPFKYDTVFNFDAKVVSRPALLYPNNGNEDFTKLCYHKRKMLQMSNSTGCKSLETSRLPQTDNAIRKKRRKVRYSDITMQQIHNPHEQVVLNQNRSVTSNTQFQQAWAGAHGSGQIAYMDADESGVSKFGSSSYGEDNSNIIIKPVTSGVQPYERIQNVPIQIPVGFKTHALNAETPVHNSSIEYETRTINKNALCNDSASNIVVQYQEAVPNQEQRIFVNAQPMEPSGPGRPEMITINTNLQDANQKLQPQVYCNHQEPYQNVQQTYINKNIRTPNFPSLNRFKTQNQIVQDSVMFNQYSPKLSWANRLALGVHQNISVPPPPRVPLVNQNCQINRSGNFERVPPVHQHVSPLSIWTDDFIKKRVKVNNKLVRKRSGVIDNPPRSGAQDVCPNVDVRQISSENNRTFVTNQLTHNTPNPSFMEDPSGYLAQQTALLNSTINRQTGCTNYTCNNVPPTHLHNLAIMESHGSGVPLPSNIHNISHQRQKNQNDLKSELVPSKPLIAQQQQLSRPHIHAMNQAQHCQNCMSDNIRSVSCEGNKEPTTQHMNTKNHPENPSSSKSFEDPVTSSTQFELINEESPDARPIQGGTISTSNVSPSEGSISNPSTPSIHNAASPSRNVEINLTNPQIAHLISSSSCNPPNMTQEDFNKDMSGYDRSELRSHAISRSICKIKPHSYTAVITTMASGRTVGSNTITSVLAGRTNTATVTVNNPTNIPMSSTPTSMVNISSSTNPPMASFSVSKSPLEMVQSVVSSIQVPPQSQHSVDQFLKQSSPQNLSPILVSSGGQLIIASSGSNIMPPPPTKVLTNQNASAVITNVTTALTQVMPAVGLGQQTVLVNAVPGPFVLQSGVAMTMDGMTVGQNVQIPHLVTGNVLPQQIQVEGASDTNRNALMLSPEGKKKNKKRKMSTQTVANMLHIASQQNTNVLMSPQGFTPQIHMTHSPQGLNTAPVMQALTIVPGKSSGTAQIVMNSQSLGGPQQLITNSQPSQQINLLQPVNLLNGSTGMVQHFPTIQQFIVPNLGGMVMNPDGTATILQDASNLGMQLQFQNLNGQNILTPVQNNSVFNTGQGILTGTTTGMVIRSPNAPDSKIVPQQHSPGNQFLPSNGGQFVLNGTQFSGQLSPLIANVSPTQVSFGSPPSVRPSSHNQDFIHAGQTLMVPCPPPAPTSNQQGTTFVQQNTTIVQQQTTMVANNQLQNYQTTSQVTNQGNVRPQGLNIDHGFVVNQTNAKQSGQSIEPSTTSYRHSVSTQTAVNQASQSVTTNTFCQTSTISASSSPDTTTHSPMACGSPSDTDASANNEINRAQGLNSEMDGAIRKAQSASCLAMVHCVSSSKPDSSDLVIQNAEYEVIKPDLGIFENVANNQTFTNKKNIHFTQVAYAESSTLNTEKRLVPSVSKSPNPLQPVKNTVKWNQGQIDNETRCSSVYIDEEGNAVFLTSTKMV